MNIKGLSKKELGQFGENLAVEYLKKQGLRILTRNYRCPKGEIDIIAAEGEVSVFIEVRTKTSGLMGLAEESIRYQKAERFRRTASYYLLEKGCRDWPPIRFDLIAILFLEEPRIQWHKGIF